MSSSLGDAARLTPRRVLATAALAAVVALGVSVTTPAGPATAAPVAASSSASSAVAADPIAASAWKGIPSRTYFIDSPDLLMLPSHEISLAGLAVKVCTAHGSGRTCVPFIEAGLRLLGHVTVLTCGGVAGFTVVVPMVSKSHCGR